MLAIQDKTERAETLANRPLTVEETGLSLDVLAELLCKQLLQSGVLANSLLAKRLALAGTILEPVVAYLKREGRIEVRSTQGAGSGTDLRFGLTERGREYAIDALARDAYVGPAPVPLADYVEIVRRQSARSSTVLPSDLDRAFADAVVSAELIDRLGPALNSGRAIFLFGAAGTGKTFLAKRLASAFGGTVLVPHAVFVNDSTVQVFDPVVHRPIEISAPGGLRIENNQDARYVRCQRPLVVAGGELTLSMLDVQIEARSGRQIAPLQWRANNGVLLIDDLGRQRVSSDALLNRWIVPMDEGHDYCSTRTGQHFVVPFDLTLIFSTNLDPTDLADDAFLRRIGYKIEFGAVEKHLYLEIFDRELLRRKMDVHTGAKRYLVDILHAATGVPLMPCFPRDLLGLVHDYRKFTGEPLLVDGPTLDWAWRNYFVGSASRASSRLDNKTTNKDKDLERP